MTDRGAVSNLKLKLLPRPTTHLSPFLREDEARAEVLPKGTCQIRVRSIGLNFRDVLNVMGLYPGDPGPPGGDCAGTVVAVGEGVEHLKVGDDVYGIAPGCLKTYVGTDAQLMRLMPSKFTYEQACALPVVAVTVEYALGDLAKVKKGDRVLIHAASGGVGLSAIQFCQRMGAIVYATVGSEAKKEHVKKLGVEYITSSRDASVFESDMKTFLGQDEGVDVVLNCLIDKFIPASLGLLKKQGRFMELGKRGIWSAEEVKEKHPDVYYETIAVDVMMEENPIWFGGMLDRVRELAEKDQIHPLPLHLFNMSDAKEGGVSAFRFLQRAQHIGKVVIQIPSALGEQRCTSEKSYVITGGTGALGVVVAQWLVHEGAKNIVLVSRSGKPSTDAAQSVQWKWLTQPHKSFKANMIICDVTKTDDVNSMITQLTSPPHSIEAVFHAAGVLSDQLLEQQTGETVEEVYTPKVLGGWNLHHALEQCGVNSQLKMFVAFSSVTALIGNFGQTNYSAANACLDGLVQYRRSLGYCGQSIQWGPWVEQGMAAGLKKHLSKVGMRGLTNDIGLRVLSEVLDCHSPQARHAQSNVKPVVVAAQVLKWRRFLQRYIDPVSPFYDVVVSQGVLGIDDEGEGSRRSHVDVSSMTIEQVSDLLAVLAQQASGSPAAPQHDSSLLDLGLDSLGAVEFRNSVADVTGVRLPQTLLFENPTVKVLAVFVKDNEKSKPTQSTEHSHDQPTRSALTTTPHPTPLTPDPKPALTRAAPTTSLTSASTAHGPSGPTSPPSSLSSPAGGDDTKQAKRDSSLKPIELNLGIDEWLMNALKPMSERYVLFVEAFTTAYTSVEALSQVGDVSSALKSLSLDASESDINKLTVAWDLLCECSEVYWETRRRSLSATKPVTITPTEDVDVLSKEINFDVSLLKPPAPLSEVRTVLLTGVTGFVGRIQLSDMLSLAAPHAALRVVCLVRAKSETHAMERIKSACVEAECWEDRFGEEMIEVPSLEGGEGAQCRRVEAIPADFEQPMFGLSQSVYDRLCHTVDMVFHTGGDVNLLSNYSRLRRTNVVATRHVIDFCTSVRLKPLHFVSTLGQFPAFFAGFAGEHSSEVIEEESQPSVSQMKKSYPPSRQGYPWSKWAAEQLCKRARSLGLPVAIFRLPNLYIGHSTGYTNRSDYAAALTVASVQEGIFPISHPTVPLTSVNTVSYMLTTAAFSPTRKHWIYHLVDERILTSRDIERWAGEMGICYRGVHVDEFVAAVKRRGAESPVFNFIPLMRFWSRFWFPDVPTSGASSPPSPDSSTLDPTLSETTNDAILRTGRFPIRTQNIFDDVPDASWPDQKEVFKTSFLYCMRRHYFPIDSQSITLNVKKILASAAEVYGIDETFLDEKTEENMYLRNPFEIIQRSFDNDCDSTFAGKLAAFRTSRQYLINLHAMKQMRIREPSIEHSAIRQPLIIVGLNRSGTTFLQHLLENDKTNRTPRFCEMLMPYGPGGEWFPEKCRSNDSPWSDDPRLHAAQETLQLQMGMNEQWHGIHEQGVDLPEEDFMILENCGRCYSICTAFRVPSYRKWLFSDNCQPMRDAYPFHKRFLQHLQRQRVGDRWLLKMPFHLFALDALFETYPDANVVFMHRDPVETLGSWCSLVRTTQTLFYNMEPDHFKTDSVTGEKTRIGLSEIGRLELHAMSEMINQAIEYRRRNISTDGSRILDVQYDALLQDPIKTVAGIYKHFNLDLTAETRSSIKKFIIDNKKNRDKLLKHNYSLALEGIDAATVHTLFKQYYASGYLVCPASSSSKKDEKDERKMT
eukprot:GHVN01066603.1.p1 GENE.GHVN01066603.1~~GHVN01066603.1.p1  ORF type:complete len:1995 (+),score=378.33 GHVN01066603.1:625-5985(+)